VSILFGQYTPIDYLIFIFIARQKIGQRGNKHNKTNNGQLRRLLIAVIDNYLFLWLIVVSICLVIAGVLLSQVDIDMRLKVLWYINICRMITPRKEHRVNYTQCRKTIMNVFS
jgi:hypothetical protein